MFCFGQFPLLISLFAWLVFWTPLSEASAFSKHLFNWLTLPFFMRILLAVAETSGLCQGAFGSRAVLVHKPPGYPAKDDLRCCSLCMFTKYYCFDGVLVDMFCCKDFDQVVPFYLQMVVCLPSILTFYWQLHFPACLQVSDKCLCDGSSGYLVKGAIRGAICNSE